jgi:hypothetical protein
MFSLVDRFLWGRLAELETNLNDDGFNCFNFE